RALLPSLLCPIDSSACIACRAVLRTTLVWNHSAGLLATTPQGDLRVARSHGYWILNCALGGFGSATRTVGGGAILAYSFGRCRQDFRLGTKFGDLSRRSQASCLSLHHNLSAHGSCLRRTDSRFRHAPPNHAGGVDNARARF